MNKNNTAHIKLLPQKPHFQQVQLILEQHGAQPPISCNRKSSYNFCLPQNLSYLSVSTGVRPRTLCRNQNLGMLEFPVYKYYRSMHISLAFSIHTFPTMDRNQYRYILKKKSMHMWTYVGQIYVMRVYYTHMSSILYTLFGKIRVYYNFCTLLTNFSWFKNITIFSNLSLHY